MTAAAPPTAASGSPPPITLPKIDRSGVMPNSRLRAAEPTRKPVMTSSSTSSAPCRVQRSRSASRNPARGGDEPHVRGDRLDEDRRDVGTVLGERGVERGDVVVGHDDRVGDGAAR